MARLKRALEWFHGTRLGRTVDRYLERRGELVAGGMSFAAVFSVFAALYVAFAVFGVVLATTPVLRDAVVATLSEILPGLIDTGHGGVVSVDALLTAEVLGWSGLVAVAVLTFTMLGWLASCREGVRQIFGLPAVAGNPVLLKLVDLLLALALGVLILLSAAASLIAARTVGWLAALLGASDDDLGVQLVLQLLGFGLGLAVNVLILVGIFRGVARVRIPARTLWTTSLIGGVALSLLTLLGSRLLGGAGTNPFLASFAVLIGLLLFFNLVSRVILLSAAFAATAAD